MEPAPYRSPAVPDPEPPPLTEEERLGSRRSLHRPNRLSAFFVPALALGIIVFSTLGIGFVGSLGGSWFVLWSVLLPFVVVITLILVWDPIRNRRLSVALHAGGVVVERAKKRAVTLFDEVDEVWLKLDPSRTPVGTIHMMRGIQVVLYDGTRQWIPTHLAGGAEIAGWVLRHCSEPLEAEAFRSLRAGKLLTFGQILLDRDTLGGPGWSVRWEDLKLVRLAPGDVSLFRGQKFFPMRTIKLDEIPHPTVFNKLVAACAKNVQKDEPFVRLVR